MARSSSSTAPWHTFPPPPPLRARGQEYTHGYPPNNPRAAPLDFTSPHDCQPKTDRQRHLQYLHSLLYVLLEKHGSLAGKEAKEKNAVRVGRIIRVLWSCKEWKEGELWREGLAWAGLDDGTFDLSTQGEGDQGAQNEQMEDGRAKEEEEEAGTEAGSEGSSSRASSPAYSDERAQSEAADPKRVEADRQMIRLAAERRLAFLRAVAARRRGLRPLLLAHRAQELIVLGRWKEALDEIELVIQSPAYRSSPELNMYAGMLVLLVSSMPS